MTFWNNLERRLTAVAIQINHAEKEGVANVAKSAYYRAAIILVCTIVEGLVYQLVKKHSGASPHIIDNGKEYKEIQELSSTAIGSSKKLWVCEKIKTDVCIDDNHVGFGKLNVYLKNKGVITPDEYRALDRIRVERNKIHLQGVGSSDTGYTKRKFNSITSVLPFLLRKLR